MGYAYENFSFCAVGEIRVDLCGDDENESTPKWRYRGMGMK